MNGKKKMKPKVKKRNPFKTWENKLDAIFSKVIRKRGYCERCKKDDYNKLQCSHIHTRTKMSVRWDQENALCLCSGCHAYWWHKHPIDAAEFAKRYLGEEKYSLLLHRSNCLKKWNIPDMEELYIILCKIYDKEI